MEKWTRIAHQPCLPMGKDGRLVTACEEHIRLSRQAATEGMVLLKNENNTLPLKAARRIAVIGPMAQNRLHLLGAWSAHGREEDAVSLFAGLENEYRGRA